MRTDEIYWHERTSIDSKGNSRDPFTILAISEVLRGRCLLIGQSERQIKPRHYPYYWPLANSYSKSPR